MSDTARRFALAGSLSILVASFSSGQTLPRFVDVASEVGISLLNVSGGDIPDYIIEANGNGAGFVDYDRDGDMDILVTNGATLETEGGNRVLTLYRNDDGVFTDMSEELGLTGRGWSGGVCVADFDNDHDPDFYVTSLGPNFLYRNDGDSGFVDVAPEAGVDDERWGENCAFGDYDRDGHVDLYVANYINFDLAGTPRRGATPNCRFMGRIDVLCGPLSLEGSADVLFRNDGDGTFSDATTEAGITDPGHYGFGVAFSDLDNDGWPDIYVANDSVPNFLLRNDRDGTFSEVGLVSGTALSMMGHPQAGMGVAIGDYDADGLFDIYVTNFSSDTNTLYHNRGDMLFVDVTNPSRSASESRLHVGWGTGFVDLDNDGWLDIFVANGHVYPRVDGLDTPIRYRQRKEVYRNLGNGTFREVAADLGEDLMIPRAGRGVAFGDFDSDGDVDVLSINRNGTPNLYENSGVSEHHWVGLELKGASVNRDAIGARVELISGGRSQFREVRSGGSYLSHNDIRLLYGLGTVDRVDEIRVRWPNGAVERFGVESIDRYVVVHEGAGETIVPSGGNDRGQD